MRKIFTFLVILVVGLGSAFAEDKKDLQKVDFKFQMYCIEDDAPFFLRRLVSAVRAVRRFLPLVLRRLPGIDARYRLDIRYAV